MEKENSLKNKILEEYKKGNIVVVGIDGLQGMPIKEFIKQPVEGMLYDLNRDEATVLTFIGNNNPKWVNDYAVMKVIIELKNRIKELNQFKKEIELKILQDVQFTFKIQSDLSTKTIGYKGLCERIEQLIKQKGK